MDRKLGFETLNDEIFQSEIKAKYKSKLFIGNYQSKSLNQNLKCYRDFVKIDNKTEAEICEDLTNFLSELAEHQRGSSKVFVGVTKQDEDYIIWTELEDELPFGKYWFQIKTIKFRFNEIQIKLKKLRSVEDSDTRTFAEKLREATKAKVQNAKNNNSNSSSDDSSDQPINDDAMEQWKHLYEFWSREFSAFMAYILSISINRKSILDTLRFISLLIVTIFAGSTKIVKYCGIFTIKLIERTTWLVHVSTPIILAIFDLFSKIVGGLYLLFAMIWRDSTGGTRRPIQNAIQAGPYQRQRQSIRYNNNY